MAAKILWIYNLLIFVSGSFFIDARGSVCGNLYLVQETGSIHSPNYPHPYPNGTNCTWTILSPPSSVLTLIVEDLDIEDDQGCIYHPCCRHNVLILPQNDSTFVKNICGHNLTIKPIQVSHLKTKIVFRASRDNIQSRGFMLSYNIESFNSVTICQPDQFKCQNGICISNAFHCDGIVQCRDGSDESSCGGLCKPNQIACDDKSNHCFTPTLERCDGIFNCPNGEDEVGCGITNHRVLDTPNDCTSPSLWCDGNCGTNNYQETCLKNSVISATIMGCLFCGLMLVLAMMCGLRLYTVHNESSSYRIHLPAHIRTRLSLTRYASLPELVEDDFFHREPPPSYSIAVGQASGNMETVSSNRAFRTRSWRQRPFTPTKPPTPPPSSETSNLSSPSRDSITSSSYLSNDDNVQLVDPEI